MDNYWELELIGFMFVRNMFTLKLYKNSTIFIFPVFMSKSVSSEHGLLI